MMVEDKVGIRYGRLIVISRADNTKQGDSRWLCLCDCGKTITTKGRNLKTGGTKSCGCLADENRSESGRKKVIDRTGLRYGRLVVISRVENSVAGRVKWNCLCDCGNSKIAIASDLGSKIQSCGCLQKESRKTSRLKHGMTNSGEYHAWVGMKQRCYNKNSHAYHNYGGRGIKVCDRWLNSFENFIADMGNRPSPKHSIDRMDNDGNYEHGNCRWSTMKEQMNNVRYNRLFTIDGMTKTASELADHFGLKLSVVHNRIARDWPVEDIFKKQLTPTSRYLTVNGITKTVTEMAKDYNIDRRLVTNRLRRGWNPEMALTKNTN